MRCRPSGAVRGRSVVQSRIRTVHSPGALELTTPRTPDDRAGPRSRGLPEDRRRRTRQSARRPDRGRVPCRFLICNARSFPFWRCRRARKGFYFCVTASRSCPIHRRLRTMRNTPDDAAVMGRRLRRSGTRCSIRPADRLKQIIDRTPVAAFIFGHFSVADMGSEQCTLPSMPPSDERSGLAG